MDTFITLIIFFVVLMLLMFICAFGYHQQSQEFLEALTADDEPQVKVVKHDKQDIGWNVQSDGNVQSPYPPQPMPTPNPVVLQQSMPYPVMCTTNQNQSVGILPYPSAPNSQMYQPPNFEKWSEGTGC
ncbi:uncharacterized protein [Chironomus tepperi]|uniref:uncharacterized protein n=1 Tax=Chironomus tepperi TaxID=113505 RepID=UPI00391F222C